MKKILSVLTIAGFLLLGSCKKENSKTENLATAISSGSWRLTLFSQKSENKTAEFAGYSFVFDANKKLLATKNGITQEGTWSKDSVANNLIIDLGRKEEPNLPLGQLTNTWVITFSSNDLLNLADDNVNAGQLVEFRKNQ